MHDFHCKQASQMYSPVLAARVRELKETPEGGDSMCEEMEKIYSEGQAEGRAEGRAEGQRNMALSLAKMGISSKKIAKAAGVSVETVEKWLLQEQDIQNK